MRLNLEKVDGSSNGSRIGSKGRNRTSKKARHGKNDDDYYDEEDYGEEDGSYGSDEDGVTRKVNKLGKSPMPSPSKNKRGTYGSGDHL